MKYVIGVYRICSKTKPERIYIGSSVNIMRRWNEHLCYLRKNKHYSLKLQNHFNKYGETDLSFSIILTCDKVDLISHEQFFIDTYNPWFNNRPTADSPLGFKLSEEAKKKISISNSRRIITEETKAKISKSNLGHIHSDETKKKMSESRKGVIFTDEHKRRLSEALMGKIVSNETKQKMSEAWIGRIVSEETKQKLSESHKGNKNSFYGKHHTEETKNKIRESRGEISIEERKRMSEKAKNRPPRSEETKQKLRDSMINRMGSIEQRIKHSIIAKKFNHNRWHRNIDFDNCPICNKNINN